MSSTAPPSTPENDSTYGGSHEGDRTFPLTPTATNYYEYNGRRYQGAHLYPYPNDEAEMDCLEMQHKVFLKNLQGKLFLAPISTPSNILDVGTGTGVWAVDVADQYPGAVVTGTDISPIQHQWVPPNCNFLVEDANSTWGFATKFDFIHCRQLRMCLDERKLFTQALKSLQPGGWLEVVEMTLPLICDDSTSEGAALRSWGEDMLEASKTLKTPFDKPYYYRQWMEEAGFVNVQEVRHDVAMNPDDEELEELGELQKAALLCGLEGSSLQIFTKTLCWSKEKLQVHLVDVRNALKKHRIHVSCRWFRVFGQRPESSTLAWLPYQLSGAPENSSSSIITSTSVRPSTSAYRPVSVTTLEDYCNERATLGLIESENAAEMISTPSSQKRSIRWRYNTQIYAERISRQKWAEHREFIRNKLFSGSTKNEILKSLKEEYGFCPSYEQLRRQMMEWDLSEWKQEKACERQLLDELERSLC